MHFRIDELFAKVYVSVNLRPGQPKRNGRNQLPYYRKLMLHEIKVLEINATQINANLMENDFRIKKINVKEEVEFHNKGN